MKRGAWGTRFGFYLAAIGSAFGLGNIWRFPYIVAENGGGAFVLLYLFLVFIIGMPLLVGELLLGKVERKSIYSAMRSLSQQTTALSADLKGSKAFVRRKVLWGLPWLGRFSIFITILVLAYYAVISGWVLHYLVQMIITFVKGEMFQGTTVLTNLLGSGSMQMFYTIVHLGIVTLIVAKDVEQGLERFLSLMMPLFILLLITLAVNTLSLESAPDAMRFLFYPDFSQLKPSSLGQALGHVFFTLSIGFGTMVTFGSYLRDKAYIPNAGFRVASLDSVISLFAGILIFPLALAGGQAFHGPELLFQAIPVLVDRVPGGEIFGIGFFLCLYLASLGASMGLLETISANFRDAYRWKRTRATAMSGLLCLAFAIFPALSSNLLSNFKIGTRGVLEWLDAFIITWLLPIAALLISQVVLYFLSEKVKKEQFEDAENKTPVKLYSHWKFVLRWIVTPLILLALGLQALELLKMGFR